MVPANEWFPPRRFTTEGDEDQMVLSEGGQGRGVRGGGGREKQAPSQASVDTIDWSRVHTCADYSSKMDSSRGFCTKVRGLT